MGIIDYYNKRIVKYKEGKLITAEKKSINLITINLFFI